jgi:hypothetical protein
VITRAFGSPKIPRTVGSGRKPGNEYVSQSRRGRFDARAIIHRSCQISNPAKMQMPLAIPSFVEFSTSKSPTRFYEDPDFKGNAMAIGAIHLAWMRRLADQGQFHNLSERY